MEAGRVEALGGGIVVTLDDVCGQDVGGERVGVPQEVGEGYCGKGIVVAEGGFVEFHHFCVAMNIVGCWK